MATGHVLFNPLAGHGTCADEVKVLEVVLEEPLEYYDMTRITNYATFLGGIEKEDFLIIAGGDGTLNRFVNDTTGIEIPQEILFYPMGTGNDFARELGKKPFSDPFPISRYLKKLPTVEIKGKTWHFINGVGFGIDGYCCEVGDQLRQIPDKKVNYTTIAIKGLLGKFNARKAWVTVDGREYTYDKVWIAPTMFGKYYGGGMIPAPEQDRNNSEGTLSVMLIHGAGRLRTLCAFPGIFQGTHVKHTKMVTIHTGREITVEFDRPTPLQIDGETIVNVTQYTARAAGSRCKHRQEIAV